MQMMNEILNADRGRGSGGGRRMGGGGGRGTGGGGFGSGGFCICDACGTKIPHRSGVPCANERCPSCQAAMNRDASQDLSYGDDQHRDHRYEEAHPKQPAETTPPRQIVKIIEEQCVGCDMCIQFCPFMALEHKDDKVYVVDDICRGCMRCVPACPSEAIQPAEFPADRSA